ncbi:MAG TPA: YebC/PmpR family DNA-binding transcriptional regulator [Firmicutes bacterium]|nr:YebC/PmpR family DNA-binding transcriptional regulator [Bacillota bacterium]
MSGHSKWANIKHRKAKADATRGKIFTRVAREIIVAARQGGGDPQANFRLRMAIQKARDVNMPNDSIVRAIKRGIGEGGEGSNYEELTYEGYGPGGVAVLLDVMTDNKNRTASDIRYIFSKHGGNLGEAGCVAWMFEKRGLITINRSDTSLGEDDLMNYAVEAGAEDFKADEETIEITTNYEDLESVREFLESKGLKLASAEITMIPKTTVPVSGKEARQVLELIESLEDHDDVQQVYANFDISEELMEQLAEA